MKTKPLIIEFTEKEDGQLAKDLENIIKNKVVLSKKNTKTPQKRPNK